MNKKTLTFLIAIALLLSVTLAGCWTPGAALRRMQAHDETEAPHQPQYTCAEAIGDITVDGKLDDPAWNNAHKVLVRFRHNAEGAEARDPAGHAAFLYTADALYIGLKMADHDIRAAGEQRDVTNREPPNDVTLVFLDVNGDSEHFLELAINPLGSFSDIFVLRPQSKSPLNKRLLYGLMFFAGYDVQDSLAAVTIDGTVNEPGDTDTGWTAELKLPFKSLMLPQQNKTVATGDVWRVQVAIQSGTDKGNRYHVWAPSFNEWHEHCVEHWGNLVFGEPRTR